PQPAQRSLLFPYTTLFRSPRVRRPLSSGRFARLCRGIRPVPLIFRFGPSRVRRRESSATNRRTLLELRAEGCRSGRTGLTRNQVYGLHRTVGSNPTPSATDRSVLVAEEPIQ